MKKKEPWGIRVAGLTSERVTLPVANDMSLPLAESVDIPMLKGTDSQPYAPIWELTRKP
jgi:hypothetical protein